MRFRENTSYCQALKIYHEERRKKLLETYRQLNGFAKKGQIVFAGSSLMERFPIAEMQLQENFPFAIYNRGIGGHTTTDLLQVMDTCIFALEPHKVFLYIGSNDMASKDFSVDVLREHYRQIIQAIRTRLPDCRVYAIGFYPINDIDSFAEECEPVDFTNRCNRTIQQSNVMLKSLAQTEGVQFIDCSGDLYDADGCLRKEFSMDGLHLWPNAYATILNRLMPYLTV